MTNSDGSLFGSGTFSNTQDMTTSLTIELLGYIIVSININARYAEIRDIPSSHQEAIAMDGEWQRFHHVIGTAKDYRTCSGVEYHFGQYRRLCGEWFHNNRTVAFQGLCASR